jgi:hypothetical protein
MVDQTWWRAMSICAKANFRFPPMGIARIAVVGNSLFLTVRSSIDP